MESAVKRPTKAARRREWRFVLLVAALIIFAAILLAATLWYAYPRGTYQPVASLDQFPPSDEPYFVGWQDTHLIIVNTGDELTILDAHSTRPGCHGGLVYWQPGPQPAYPGPYYYDADAPQGYRWLPEEPGRQQTGTFRDPCHGAVYDLDGDNVVGAGPPARSLDRYPYEIRSGELWMCQVCMVRGELPDED